MVSRIKDIEVEEAFPLYATIFFSFLGYALTITLYVPMLLDEQFLIFSVTTPAQTKLTVSGLLLAMYPLGQFLGSPIIGSLSERYGRKKVLLISLTLCTLGYLGIYLGVKLCWLGLLFFSSFFTGLCESNMAIAQSALAEKTNNIATRTKLIGYGYSVSSLGYIVGPMLSSITLDYAVPFLLTALIIPFLIVWVAVKFDEQNNKVRPQNKVAIFASLNAFKDIFSRSIFYKIYLINFCIFFAVQGLYRVVPLYVVDTWDPSLKALSWLIAFVSFICFSANLFLLKPLARCFNSKQLLTVLLISGGILVIMLTLPANFSVIWLMYGLAAIPTVMALPTCTVLLTQHIEHGKGQSQILGNNQALLVLAEASSAALGGVLAAVLVSLPIISMGVILIIAGFWAYKYRIPTI
ncbi:MAG: MFS transporter [Gammaproteobacteria bacterium]|nr:MFS transporter [Gammaproteobacteria bacterium]